MPLFDYEDEIIDAKRLEDFRKRKVDKTRRMRLPSFRFRLLPVLLLVFVLVFALPLWLEFAGMQRHFGWAETYIYLTGYPRAAVSYLMTSVMDLIRT